jgi:outer membrane protein
MKKLLLAIVLVFSVGAVTAQTKIAHVNSQVLLDTLESRKIAIKKLQDFEKAGVTELQEMEADLNTAYAAYEAKAGDLSPVMRQIEEGKLMEKQKRLQDREQSLNKEMQAYSQELNAPILEMVQNAVKIVSERNKLSYVIDESVTLYFAGGTDITAEVIAELKKLDK